LHCEVYPIGDNLSVKLTDLELEAWQAFLHAHQQITNTLDAELRQSHGISLSDYDVLLRLARAPDRKLRMSDLAGRVMFSPSGLTRVVDRLVDVRLVERERDSADARVVFARLTAQGHELLRKAAQTHVRGIRQHFTGRLNQRQLRAVAEALAVIAGPHKPH
jgi:DNA-binding MarR family transcriptional regulator